MSFQGSIYVSTARNSRHLTRAMLAEMVEHESEVLTTDQEEIEVWLNGGHSDFVSSMVELQDSCFNYTKLNVWFEDGQWNTTFGFSKCQTEIDDLDHSFNNEYNHYDDYSYEMDCIYDSIYDM